MTLTETRFEHGVPSVEADGLRVVGLGALVLQEAEAEPVIPAEGETVTYVIEAKTPEELAIRASLI